MVTLFGYNRLRRYHEKIHRPARSAFLTASSEKMAESNNLGGTELLPLSQTNGTTNSVNVELCVSHL